MRFLCRCGLAIVLSLCLCVFAVWASAGADITAQTENVCYTVTDVLRYGDMMRYTLTVEPLHDGIRVYDIFDEALGLMEEPEQGIVDCVYEIWDEIPGIGLASSRSCSWQNGISTRTFTNILIQDVPASFKMKLHLSLRDIDTHTFQDEVVLSIPLEMTSEAQEWRTPLAFTDEERTFHSIYVAVSPLATMVQILYTNNRGNEDGYLGFAVLDEEGEEFRGEGIANWELPDQPKGQLLSYVLYPPVEALPNPLRLWIRDPGYVLTIGLTTGQCQRDTL